MRKYNEKNLGRIHNPHEKIADYKYWLTDDIKFKTVWCLRPRIDGIVEEK